MGLRWFICDGVTEFNSFAAPNTFQQSQFGSKPWIFCPRGFPDPLRGIMVRMLMKNDLYGEKWVMPNDTYIHIVEGLQDRLGTEITWGVKTLVDG